MTATCAGCGTTSDTDTLPEGWIEHYGVYGCDACRVGFKLPFALASIRRLDVRPGDTIVLTVREHMSQQQIAIIRQQWVETFPDAKAIVLAPGMDVSIVGPADDA